MNTLVRQATIEDVPLLQKLNQEVFIEDFQYDSDLVMDWALSEAGKNYFTKFLSEDRNVCFIVEIGGKAVGYVSGAPKIIEYRKSRYLEISNMGVMPEFRSKGIGSQLVDRLKMWAKERDYQLLFVNSYFRNKKANEFYKRNGFAEIDLGLEMEI